MLWGSLHASFSFELAEWAFVDGLMREVEGVEEVAFAELLLVEVMLNLPHPVALLDFLHEA